MPRKPAVVQWNFKKSILKRWKLQPFGSFMSTCSHVCFILFNNLLILWLVLMLILFVPFFFNCSCYVMAGQEVNHKSNWKQKKEKEKLNFKIYMYTHGRDSSFFSSRDSLALYINVVMYHQQIRLLYKTMWFFVCITLWYLHEPMFLGSE